MSKSHKKIEFEVNEDGCFICTSHCKDTMGYHLLSIKDKRYKIHRFIYQEMFGEIPEGLVVRHKCDNRSCINPEHLEVGTQKENVMDMIVRGRMQRAKGSKHGGAKLNEETVKEIKELLNDGCLTQMNIAEKFGISRSNIQNIASNKVWKHVQ